MSERQPRVKNRTIIVVGLVCCVLLAVVLAWLLGVFERSGAVP